MQIFLISDNVDTLTGMNLTGIKGVIVHERDEFKRALDKALADTENGIVLITEKLTNKFPELIGDIKLKVRLPLILEIPDRHGTGRKPNFITSYINEAIGLKL